MKNCSHLGKIIRRYEYSEDKRNLKKKKIDENENWTGNDIRRFQTTDTQELSKIREKLWSPWRNGHSYDKHF